MWYGLVAIAKNSMKYFDEIMDMSVSGATGETAIRAI